MPAPRLRDRPTADLAILAIVALIIFVVVVACIGVAIVEIDTDGEADTRDIVGTITTTLKVLVGAVVGYVAGRSTNHHAPPPSHDAPEP